MSRKSELIDQLLGLFSSLQLVLYANFIFTSIPTVIQENWWIIQLSAFELSEFTKYNNLK